MSVTRSNCESPLRILIGVDDAVDAALPVAQSARDALRAEGYKIDVLIAKVLGPNRKASILAECVKRAGGDFDAVVVADSNVDLEGFDLDRMLAHLVALPTNGAIWAPFYERSTAPAFGNVASEAVLHFSWHSFGLLSRIDPKGMVGKLFVVRKEALHTIDDFWALVRFQGEDMALGRALSRANYSVKPHLEAARSLCGKKSWSETLSRHSRWMMVIKAQRPRLLVSYPLLFFNTLFVILFALLAFPFHPLAASATLTAAILLRLGVGAASAHILGLDVRGGRLVQAIFVADILLLVAFVRTLGTRRFVWRGRELTIGKTGELEDCCE